MKITVHRGSRQIGGVVVEISAENNRVFIDIGADLPGAVSAKPFQGIDGLTCGDSAGSALFLTHYHGDHVGRLEFLMPDVPVYMGETAKQILVNLISRVNRSELQRYEKIITFKAAEKIDIGGINVMPLMVDHSAFDAYMFVVSAGGKRILHTGDFRTHGFRGGKTAKMLSVYAKDIDYIISEGTMLSRTGDSVITERELQKKAAELMRKKKYSFVLCSSTNIDRIAAFYHAGCASGRIFICDSYQARQLETVRAAHASKSTLYDFERVYTVERFDSVSPKLVKLMESAGFCMLIRKGEKYREYLDKFYNDNDCAVIYSMWGGYLRGAYADPAVVDFLAPYSFVELHSSGHATAEALKEVYDTLKPKKGLIPFHSENPEGFESIVGKDNVILLRDGEVFNA